MELKPGNQYTIANFCDQFEQNRIKVDTNYQRSPSIWSTAARSYLIETILSGFPIPKLIMRQTINLGERRTELEVVDGQQRSVAIRDFYNNDLRISRGRWKGRKFADLTVEEQTAFLEYSVGYDVLVSASDFEVREVYRRINSYTTPLNKQEIRFASSMGEEGTVKWLVFELAESYAQMFKVSGVLTEKQLSRMQDQELIAMLLSSFKYGIYTSSPAKLDELYSTFEVEFPERADYERRAKRCLDWFADLRPIFETPLATREQFLSLSIAYLQCVDPIPSVTEQGVTGYQLLPADTIAANLGYLLKEIAKVDEDEEYLVTSPVATFLSASREGTNTLENRKSRIVAFIKALSVAQGADEP